MPAKNPRLTITLQPTLAAQLRKLSELTGNSQSSLIGELLEGSGPVFDRMIQVMEAAKTAKESMRGRIAGDIEQAQARLEEGLGMALEGFDQWTGSLLDEAEAVTRRGVGKRSAARPHDWPGLSQYQQLARTPEIGVSFNSWLQKYPLWLKLVHQWPLLSFLGGTHSRG